jgi:hypothetical protein
MVMSTQMSLEIHLWYAFGEVAEYESKERSKGQE